VVEQVAILRVGHRGDGVAEAAGSEVFVPCTLPGEEVSVAPVEGHPERRTLLRIDRASPERVAPVCPHFGICGGCAVQHWRAGPYRDWKRDLVVAALAQAGVAAPVGALIDAHGDGRRRVTLHARRGSRDVLQVGFAAPRAHEIVPIDRCPVLAPALARAIEIAWRLAEAVQPLRKPLDIQVTATDTGLDVDLRGSGPLAPAQQAALVSAATASRLARLSRHGELLVQTSPPVLQIGPALVRLPPAAFLQATAAGEQALAGLVLAQAGTARRAADLFCGVGPFALRLAARMRVAAFDGDAGAVAALTSAAAHTSGLKPVSATARDLFRRPLLPEELAGFDLVVFDPPRQGAQAQARQLAQARVPRVLAVSCNPATFARDARLLTDGGHRLIGVTPVDQFRYSAHVELVGLFER
jgi:23S rRNA (uracil1939-C5)-methyltransferase